MVLKLIKDDSKIEIKRNWGSKIGFLKKTMLKSIEVSPHMKIDQKCLKHVSKTNWSVPTLETYLEVTKHDFEAVLRSERENGPKEPKSRKWSEN